MHKYLVDSTIDIKYIDTDGIIVEAKTDKNFHTSSKLGDIKLENSFEKVWALGPKFYGGLTTSGKVVVKAKGYNGIIDYKLLGTLLTKGNVVKLPMEKWYKDIEHGHITSKEMSFTLRTTDFKRKAVYGENSVLIGTEPYILNDKKEIINKS